LPELPIGTVAVLLPGSGSDAVFVRRAFEGPLRAFGIPVQALPPTPGADLVAHYRRALDAALDAGRPVLAGGISLGAHIAASWAADRRDAGVVGLLLALPAWRGPAGSAPAALAARLTAAQVRREGTAGAVAAARGGGAPDWLVAELARAWAGYGGGLADALEAAAATAGPDDTALATLRMPVGVVGLTGDPVHPHAEAAAWARRIPAAQLCTASFTAFGTDPAVLGRAALLAWLRAAALARG
jgi:pimeloyl-ACP methyl ester carboxylesterase